MDSSWTVVLVVAGVILALVFLVVAVVLFVKLVKLRTLLKDPDMPVQGKVAFWSAIVYSVVPIDLLPDPVYLDDIGALAAAIMFINKLAGRHLGRRSGYPPPPIDGHGPRR